MRKLNSIRPAFALFAVCLCAVLLSLIETASNTRQIMLLLRRQEADRRAVGLRGTPVQR